MTMGDFSTAVKYNLPIKVFIFNNFAYHFIELEQLEEGIAECYTKLHNPNYGEMAKTFGGDGFTIKTPDELEEKIKAALASDKPTLVDIHIATDELITPNKVTAEMVMSFIKGVVKTKLSGSND